MVAMRAALGLWLAAGVLLGQAVEKRPEALWEAKGPCSLMQAGDRTAKCLEGVAEGGGPGGAARFAGPAGGFTVTAEALEVPGQVTGTCVPTGHGTLECADAEVTAPTAKTAKLLPLPENGFDVVDLGWRPPAERTPDQVEVIELTDGQRETVRAAREAIRAAERALLRVRAALGDNAAYERLLPSDARLLIADTCGERFWTTVELISDTALRRRRSLGNPCTAEVRPW